MMKLRNCLLPCLALIVAGVGFSQSSPAKVRPDRYAGLHYPEDARKFRGWRHHGQDIPVWDVHPELPRDVFTFARLRYPYRKGFRWQADYPEAELHLSWRLHQLTSIQVNPYPVIVDLEAEQLREHPFLFISEPSNMNLSDAQARLLGDYLQNGGFILIDDFWGGDEWRLFAPTLKRIWPQSDPVELTHNHPLFHCVFDLKEPPQVHSNVFWDQMRRSGRSTLGNEIRPDAAAPIFRALYDTRGRMVMLICLNNDLGDGWEQEAFDPDYFREVSEKHAFPLGINIVFYALTH
ncbi:MAG: DUF4159 domain-containing protein [Verrucomicrobiaceae bacterium]|nr:DUF4159 domain-containing protein [Verrucomicrobiaceae bacterium]